jgi:hypothetical protein
MDRLRSVRARFRADVDVGGRNTVADGILLVRRPGAIRVKLFGIAGFTVHDAIWRGDSSRVRGRVSGIDREEPLDLVQTPRQPVEEPAARFSLVLWSLWQPRCARPPAPVTAAPETFALDPASAQARSREVRLVGEDVVGETLVSAEGDTVVVAYSDFEPRFGLSLPRRIDLEVPAAGWTAAVAVSEYEVDEALDDAIFALPESERHR